MVDKLRGTGAKNDQNNLSRRGSLYVATSNDNGYLKNVVNIVETERDAENISKMMFIWTIQSGIHQILGGWKYISHQKRRHK